jgi:DNA-binding transcriptional regulator YiaG
MTPEEFRSGRQALGMTQQQLANAMGLTGDYAKDTIRNWETGKRPISGTAATLLRYMLKFGQLPG